MLYKQPKIMKPLARAISYEIHNPGELALFLEYQHLLAGSREVDKQNYKQTVLRRKTNGIKSSEAGNAVSEDGSGPKN